jgi:hypothetical protein
MRTVHFTKGKKNKKGKKIPTFDNKKLTASQGEFNSHKEAVIIESKQDESLVEFDIERGKIYLNYKKGAYKPINVYKSLYKMAICALEKEEIADYQDGLSFLLNNDGSDFLEGELQIFEIQISDIFKTPFGMLFKKIDESSKIPTHTFVFVYRNLIFQIHLPFNHKDYDKYDCLTLHKFPPLMHMNSDPFKYEATLNIKDFSSKENVQEEDRLAIQFDKKALKKLSVYDPTTGSINEVEFKQEIVKRMIIVWDEDIRANLPSRNEWK